MEEKVTCAICKNELNRKCVVKRNNTVSLNKRRRCKEFVLEPLKVKAKQILKTTRLTYREKEILRQQYKDELKRYRKMEKQRRLNQAPNPVDRRHPLTGDLSRFVSTVGEND